MHYTSIENIHKVIDPLFLDALRAELDAALEIAVPRQRDAALLAFQQKLASLTFLDPACGSGNFLTETYLSLRRLENRALAARLKGQGVLGVVDNPVCVSIQQFHGIEINDFAVSVAKTALWIAESQMLAETLQIVSLPLQFLPLESYDGIVEGNALRLDWGELISRGGAEPRRNFDYIMGNPPFIGGKMMDASQKEDMLAIFGKKWKNLGNMDYVCCWYKKAFDLMRGTSTRAALVSTNSITQGQAVASLLGPLMKDGLQIDFAHRTFRWDSESIGMAHVHCVIIDFSVGGAGGAGVPPAEFAGETPAPPTPAAWRASQGWHERHYLPHAEFRRLQFITFRLFDSVPADVVLRWKAELRITEATAPASPEAIELLRRIERHEDAGHGACFLRDPRIAALVRRALFHFDGNRYRLLSWCIMPNHVHVLVEVAEGQTLSGILHSWRSFTAHEANKILGRDGPFWQPEYFDRFIRDAEHLRKTIDYIASNPARAGLTDWAWTGGAGVPPAISAGETPAPQKPFYDGSRYTLVPHINPYLLPAPDIWIESRTKPLCDVPAIKSGGKPVEGGNLLFTPEEKSAFLALEPTAARFFRPFTGSEEFINGIERWCLWLADATPSELRAMPHVMERVQRVRDFRLASVKPATRQAADTPWRFMEVKEPGSDFILIPAVSSERRRYVPMGFLSAGTIPSNLASFIPSASLYHFGILISNVHMAWMRAVCGRLEMRYRYSANIVYNNFPWPDLRASAPPREKIETTARAILDARAAHPDATLADLYDPLTMPPDLLAAHRANDRAVMSAYGFDLKMAESDCVAALFKLYQTLAHP